MAGIWFAIQKDLWNMIGWEILFFTNPYEGKAQKACVKLWKSYANS